MWLHTLNLDYSTTLTSFREDCFSCMPKLMCFSMCETRISNLWTTIAALSKLCSLVELRFQNWLCCNDVGSSGGDDQTGPSQPSSASYHGTLSVSLDLLTDLNSMTEQAMRNLLPFNMNHNFQSTNEESSDDSEVDFSIHLNSSSNAPPGWNREINLLSEVNLWPLITSFLSCFHNSILRGIRGLKKEVIGLLFNGMMVSRRNNFVAQHR